MNFKIRVFCRLAVVFISILFAGCGSQTLSGEWVYKEIGRFKSPDASVDAVVVSGDGGATTSTVTSVYLVDSGTKVRDPEALRAVFDADHLKNFQIAWNDRGIVEIQYEEARILHFMNYWANPKNFRTVVEIRLVQNGTNFALPYTDRHF